MKTKEIIENMQSKLIRKVTEASQLPEEQSIRLLEGMGLNSESAKKLLEAFREAERAKEDAKNVWNSAVESKSEEDASTKINESRQKESESRHYFDTLNSEYAILIVTRTLDPNRFNDEILEELYSRNIDEQKITNPALRLAYHYYCKDLQNDESKATDNGKVKLFYSKVKAHIEQLNRRIESLQNQLDITNKAYINLRSEYTTRTLDDEKHYQDALKTIDELRVKVNQLQKRNVFQVMGDKIFGKNKPMRLPRGVPELPKTLFASTSEKAGIPKVDQEVLQATPAEPSKPNTRSNRNKNEQLQQ